MKKGRMTTASGMLASINENDIIKPTVMGKGVTTRMNKRKSKVSEPLVCIGKKIDTPTKR
jgi:hypothetical protein